MLWFFVIITALLAAAGGFYWRWRRTVAEDIAEGAALEWAYYQKNEPKFLEGMSEAQLREVYARVHTPRFPGYVLAAAAAFFVSLPLTFIALSAVLMGLQATGAIPEPVEVVEQMSLEGGGIKVFGNNIDEQSRYEMALYYVGDMAGFYYFFGVLIVWLFIVGFFMRRFHARRPGYMRDEIIRSREQSSGAA